MKIVIKEWSKDPVACLLMVIMFIAKIIYMTINAKILIILADIIADYENLSEHIWFIVIILMIQCVLCVIITWTNKTSHDHLYTKLTSQYSEKILNADYKMFVKYSQAYIQTSSEEIARICNLGRFIVTGILNLINCGIIIYHIYSLSSEAVIPIIVVYAFLCIPITWLYNVYTKIDKNVDKERHSRNQEIEECINGFAEVRSFCTEKHHISSILSKNGRIYKFRFKRNWIDAGINFTVETVESIAMVISLFFIARAIDSGTMGLAAGMALINYIWRLPEPIIWTLDLVSEISAGLSMLDEYNSIIGYRNMEKPTEEIELTKFSNDISVENVGFSYGNTDCVLNGMNMTIHKGQKIGICGVSGGGKTTLFKLLAKFYTPDTGTIKIDGVEFSKISDHSLRKRMGIVHQDGHIFSGTIYENIIYGNWGSTETDVVEAAKKANLYNFIMSLPDKWNAKVGPRGLKLSGGQKQRISLARIFLTNPDIILLDEATSALDNESEAAIQESLEKFKDKTIIMIAHRLTTIKNCDTIFVIGDHKVLEKGNHEELMKLDGAYASLVNGK